MAGDRRTQPAFCDLWTDGHVCPTTLQGYATNFHVKIKKITEIYRKYLVYKPT